MNIKQINPKTNKKEKKLQCTNLNCLDWVFISEYQDHKCEVEHSPVSSLD